MTQNHAFPSKDGLTELWLHYLWWDNTFIQKGAQTMDGKRVRILFPGWYNKGWGPDFMNARIQMNNIELFGDIEIHIHEQLWREHQHHQNDAYNKVILHIFAYSGIERQQNTFSHSLPSICLSDSFPHLFKEGTPRKESLSDRLPGACGLSLRSDNYSGIQGIIFKAAENRIFEKAEAIREETEEGLCLENILFMKISRAVGYSAFSENFEKLARAFPYSSYRQFGKGLYRQNRTEILGRWFGYLGMLNQFKTTDIHEDYRREWLTMVSLWNRVAPGEQGAPIKPTTASRPYNHPLRRLLGLFYHLEKVSFTGLLKSWLKLIFDSGEVIRQHRNPRTRLLEKLQDMFPQPSWEILGDSVTFKNGHQTEHPPRLIGKERLLAIFVNAIIPVFMLWADENERTDVKKILFAMYLALPSEASNRKSRFMEKRLFTCHPAYKSPKSLNYHQGLIQLYNDCCSSFYEGCENCSLVRMIHQENERK